MQRVRRLASIAIIVVLGATGLSACRSEPGVAAYVGDRKITEDEVTQVLQDAGSRVPSPSASPDPAAPPGAPPVKAVTRAEVVRVLVLEEVCRRLAADKGFQPVQRPPVDEWAQQRGLPLGSRYVEHSIEVEACISGVPAGEPVAPTQEDLTDMVARGKAADVVPPEVTVEEFGQRFDGEALRHGLAVRNTLTEAVARYDVTLSPRTGLLEYPLLTLGEATIVVVPIGDGGPGTVVDAR
jgi:hypothetical protein